MLAVLALASCSKSELATRPDDGRVEIKLNTLSRSIETRIPHEAITSSTKLTASILVTSVSGNYEAANLYGGGAEEIIFSDQYTAQKFSPSRYYPTDGSSVYLLGLHPSSTWTGLGSSNSVSFTFDGKDDVMIAPQIESKKSDVAQTYPSYPTLTFEHLLTKLTIETRAMTAAAASAWGDIVGITLVEADGVSVNSTITVDLTTGTATTATAFSNQKTEGITFYRATGIGTSSYTDDPISESASITLSTTLQRYAAYALVPPIMADGDNTHYRLKIDTKASGSENISTSYVDVNLKTNGVDAFMGDTQGKHFNLMLTFNASEIMPTPDIKEWDGSTDVEVPIE